MRKLKAAFNPNTRQFWEQKYSRDIKERQIRSDGRHLLRFMHLFNRAESILDFGSGLGGNVQFLAARLKEKRFILVDHSETSLNFAREKLLGETDRHGNSFEYYPDLDALPEGSVDMVLSIEVLEHITAYRQILDRFWEIINKDGILLISVPVLGLRDRTRVHVNRFTVTSMFKILTSYSEIIHISPRTYSKRSGRLSTAYFYVEKPT